MSASLYEEPSAEISQGDIFEAVPHHYLNCSDDGSAEHKRVPGKGILLTHDCDVDKVRVKRWTFCPIVPLQKLEQGAQGDARRNRIFAFFFLPKYGPIEEDSFVDFFQVSSIDKNLVSKLKRILSLSDEGRRALYTQHIRFATRWQLRDITCPACHAEFNPADHLTVR